MPRTAKAPTTLTRDAGVNTAAAGVSTTIDATLVTNGVSITGGGDVRGRLVLTVTNTSGAAKVVTVKGGPSWGADGDLAVTVALTSGEQTIVLGDTARHRQADGAVHVDFAAGHTGVLRVLRVPR